MAASVTSPADVVNLALRRIGYRLRVGQLYDGSDAANNALDVYAQTRDAVLRAGDWGFAQITIVGVPAGTGPPTGWGFAYQYPTDCLRVRNVFDPAYAVDPTDPLPVLWEIVSMPSGKIIVTNQATALIVYTLQQTDPSVWDPLFVEAFAVELAKRLAPMLSSLDAEKIASEEEKAVLPAAEGMVG